MRADETLRTHSDRRHFVRGDSPQHDSNASVALHSLRLQFAVIPNRIDDMESKPEACPDSDINRGFDLKGARHGATTMEQ
jgi:hypothetical protein